MENRTLYCHRLRRGNALYGCMALGVRSFLQLTKGKLLRRIRISTADKLFSLYIRRRDKWTCQRCGKQYEEGTSALQCSHFWGRGCKGTRFEPDNAEALCYGCHSLWEGNKQGAYRYFKLKRLGEKRYKTLEVQASTPTKVDEKMVVLGLRKLLAELDKNS